MSKTMTYFDQTVELDDLVEKGTPMIRDAAIKAQVGLEKAGRVSVIDQAYLVMAVRDSLDALAVIRIIEAG